MLEPIAKAARIPGQKDDKGRVVATTAVLAAQAFLFLGIAVSVIAFLLVIYRRSPSWYWWLGSSSREEGSSWRDAPNGI
jgi:hypothetical protein